MRKSEREKIAMLKQKVIGSLLRLGNGCDHNSSQVKLVHKTRDYGGPVYLWRCDGCGYVAAQSV